MPDQSVEECLTLETERKDDMVMVRCKGRLQAGVSDAFYAKVSKLIPGNKRIVLDLTDLTRMDSMGIGALVRLYVSAKSAGCKLELVNLGKRVREVLGITHLLSVFSIIGEHGPTIRY
jgi:anti-sigma B factor antagonist